MPHIVTTACVDHKYQECVAVCPVDAFREADRYLVIDPDECIDCGACIPECPVDAIFADTDIPEEEEEWICLLYTSPSPRDQRGSRMPSSA